MGIRRRRHVDRVNKFILVWSGDEREQLQFDGEVFWMPATTETAKTGEGSQFRFEGARDVHSELIAGTLLITDRIRSIDGNRIKIFDADEFVRWVEGVRGDLLDRGLVICDLVTEVPAALLEGRPLWQASRDAWARETLEVELGRRKKWEEKGLPAPQSSSEEKVLKALTHQRDRGAELSAIDTGDIVAALSGQAPPAKPLVEQKPVPTLQKLDGRKLFMQAQNFGLNLKKAELEGLLRDDEDTMKAVADVLHEKAEASPKA